MIVFLIIICILFLFPPLCTFNNLNLKKDYLDKDSALPIKGLFVVLVFFSHFQGYVNLSNSFIDASFVWIMNLIGQLTVVMFFFYSGYGMFLQLNKKDGYIKKFIAHRFLPVWISFAICVLFYFIENLLLQESFGYKETILAFIGWTSIGNSNWFMFITFALYIIFYACFRFLSKERTNTGLIMFTIFSIILCVILWRTKESWWYNTLLCFPLGMWFCKFKEEIDKIVSSNKNWAITGIVLITMFVISFFLMRIYGVFYCIYSMIFTLIVVWITMKIKFKSLVFSFIGKHVFSIYILQRLIFRLFKFFPEINNYVLLIVSFILVVAISTGYDYLFNKTQHKMEELISVKRVKEGD